MCGGNGPDGWREALHRVHEALFEACWPGTQEPILSARKGPVARTAHREARVGGKLLTDDMELCIECARHRETDLEALRQRHDRPASQKRDTPTRRSFEPSSNLERKRVCNREVPQLQQGFVPARTRSRTESHPCTPLSPGTTGLVETALQDDRPAACV